jgi:hypothetical protein
MYPASRESVAFGDQAMMRSAHAVPNNFVRSSKQTCFPNRVYNMPINRCVISLCTANLGRATWLRLPTSDKSPLA